MWALFVAGIGFAASFPNRRGLGTCDVAVLDMEGETVSDAILSNTQDKLDLERPCCSKGALAVKPVLTAVDLEFELSLDGAYSFSDTGNAPVKTGSTSTVIQFVAGGGSTFNVGDWVAVVELRQAREILSVDTGKFTVKNHFTDDDGDPIAPTAGYSIIPGCPTYDSLARSIKNLFLELNPGATYYKDAGEWSIRNNPEVISVNQSSPAGNVTAQVDAVIIEALRLGELILKTP